MNNEAKYQGLLVENAQLKEQLRLLQEESNVLKKSFATNDQLYKEQFYRITENVNDIVYRFSLTEMRFEYISPQISKLFGYSQKEFYESSSILKKIIHPDFHADFFKYWREIKNGVSPDYYTLKILRKDLQERWIQQKNLLVSDPNGNVIAIEGIVSDVTDKKISEEAIIKNEAQIKAILNNLPHLAWLKSCDGYYLAVNDSFASSVGSSPEDIIGKNDYDIYSPEKAQQYRDQDLNLIVHKEKLFLEEQHHDSYWETFKAPIFDHQGEVIGITGISLEITKRKKNEEEIKIYSERLAIHNAKLKIINDELKRAKEKAEESDKLKSAFLANMSHEIRTPMNAILGFATLLKNKRLPEEKRDNFIDLINANCRQLLRIITDIIDISKIEAGQISIYNKNFNLNHSLQSLHSYFKEQIKTLSKPIDINFTPGLSSENAMIYTDKVRIEQILSNLLSNAVKFTNEGAIELGYNILDNTRLVFYVKDTGIGMTEKEQKIVFEHFRQANTSYNKLYGGTGLGLSISKGLADLLNGRITLASEYGVGSTFYLEVPFKPGFSTDEPILESSPNMEYYWPNKTILIAEDEEANYSLLENIIRPTRARIIRALNGREAVDYCSSNPNIDLVLMDVKMPEMNGLEATARIKKDHPDISIIIQTAYAMSSDEEKGKLAGCDDYFSKPLKIDDLLKKINQQLMHKRVTSRTGSEKSVKDSL